MTAIMMIANRTGQRNIGYHGKPFRWDEVRAEPDVMIVHFYGFPEDEFAHTLSTFPLVWGGDEGRGDGGV